MVETIKYLEARIDHAKTRVDLYKEKYKDRDTQKDLNYHAGKSLGHWQGKLSAYENILDTLKGRLNEDT